MTTTGAGSLDRRLCQVVGLNQNYLSSAGTLYHIQVEDRGPVVDRVSEQEVRRVNVIVYANYGEPNARIIYGHDYDFPDLRTHEHNAFIKSRIGDLAAEARRVVEEKEARLVAKVKGALRDYYMTKSEEAKKEFEEANAAYPFLFSRAWMELKQERAAGTRPAPPAPAPAPPEAEVVAPEDVLYPLDAELREKVIEIERLIIEVGQDLARLKAAGKADDILVQTCRKLVMRAKESLSGRDPAEFSSRRLDMTRNSLMTTWRQIKSRLR
ncbi:MAG TPA: hypothetical protein VFM29_04645 [Vicinamibacteria bacterium]|nr:hypothetical protein [Vicinamibacteria bacterium]